MTPIEDYIDQCSFCAEVAKEREFNLFHELYGDSIMEAYILRETHSFIVVPALGSFVEGYLLIGPKQHCSSMGHLNDAELNELAVLIDEVRAIVAQEYSAPVFFEHGAISFTLRGGCCTDHAHLHVVPVPLPVDLESTLAGNGVFSVDRLGNLLELQRYVQKRQPYLFFCAQNGEMTARAAPNAASQYFRKHLAQILGVTDHWDWRSYPGTVEILRTIEKLKNWPSEMAGGASSDQP